MLLQLKANYTSVRFNRNAQRYIGPNGRFLSPKAMSEVIRSDIDAQSENLLSVSRDLQPLAQQRVDGEITDREWRTAVAAWRQQMAESERDIDLNYACAARGGTEQMDFRAYGRCGARIKKRLRYLDDFAQECGDNPAIVLSKAEGKMPFLERVQLHADVGWFTFCAERADSHYLAGFTRRRNVPHSGESCKSRGIKVGCAELTKLGWQPIKSPHWREVGDRTCGPKDECDEEFDKGDVTKCIPFSQNMLFHEHGGY